MGRVVESVSLPASLAETWDLYFDPRRWPAWVDGFEHGDASGGYPEAGGVLRWRSNPAGRGEVVERVIEHEPRRLHAITFEDPQSEGSLRTTFAIEGDGTRVTQEVEYGLRSRPALGRWLTDRLFVRPQVRGSLRRSLGRLRTELETGRRS